jgi:hypothetical protein
VVSGCLPWGDEDGPSAADAAGEQARQPRRRVRVCAQRPGGSHDDELTEDDREWARRTVTGLPPLTDRQRDILALLLLRRR